MTGDENIGAMVEGEDTSLLIVDDDKPFLTRLARAMETRGFVVETAESVEEAVGKARANPPAYAVVDMRLGDGNGLDVVAAIREKREDSRTIILTGYGNIATAVEAIKLGACHYLAKPSNTDDIEAAFGRAEGNADASGTARCSRLSAERGALGAYPRAPVPMSRPQRLRDRPPASSMHRRTLQRIARQAARH